MFIGLSVGPKVSRWRRVTHGKPIHHAGGKMEHAAHDGTLDQTQEQLLVITDSAVEMITQAMKQAGMNAGGVHVAVTGGGCEGFQYNLTLVAGARRDDEIVE